jgi:hypothetical protein
MGLKARATGGTSAVDAAEVRRALSILADPANGCELRGLPSGRSAVRPGRDLDALLDVARLFDDDRGVYYALNPVPADLKWPTKVADVLCRRWFLIDVDASKPPDQKDNPSTDLEHEAARALARRVREHLTGFGWPAPLVVDSGNGWHLLYRVDLPNDEHARVLLRTILHALAERFDGPDGSIDRAVHNSSRIARLPGTLARKGVATKERPHRMCRLVEDGPAAVVGAAALLAAAAKPGESPPALAPEPAPEAPQAERPSGLKARAVGSPDHSVAWSRSAMERELGRVAMAPAGERNKQLNASAFSLGQIVAGGGLARGEVEQALTEAAARSGLDRDPGCGPAGIAATIRSGLESGAKEPRKAPEQATRTVAPSVPASAKPIEGPIIIRASAIAPRRVEWLWPFRIPLGKLTTFAGVGGLGKTFVLCDISARVTTGSEWPDAAGECAEPGQVLFVSGEDDPEDTLVPRLMELGADRSRVVFLRTAALDQFQLSDLKMLDRAVEEAQRLEPPVRLVVIDPPTAYLGGVDDHKNGELRTLLGPLKNWAEQRRVALVFNTHVNKAQGKIDAMQRVMGSVAWVNAVRAAHIFSRDPEDEERRLFIPMKNNIAKERKGMAYKIVERPNDRAAVEWLGEVELTADQAVNREDRKPKREVLAKDWLIEQFRSRREWSSDELFKAGKAQGISRNAIYEAKALLALPKARKVTHESGDVEWVWWVPADWAPLTEGATPETVGHLGHLDEVEF